MTHSDPPSIFVIELKINAVIGSDSPTSGICPPQAGICALTAHTISVSSTSEDRPRNSLVLDANGDTQNVSRLRNTTTGRERDDTFGRKLA